MEDRVLGEMDHREPIDYEFFDLKAEDAVLQRPGKETTMLVVSRKENQRFLFPNLGISCEIVRITGNRVRVAIDAPKDVRILREEIADAKDLQGAQDVRQQRHELKNRLHTANLALHLMQKQLDHGLSEQAEKTLDNALQQFAELDRLFAESAGGKSKSESNSDRRRVLIVEDNAHERELLAGYLELCGYDVSTAKDGVDAIDWLAEHERPDIVLLDMQMPRMDGRQTISAIRANPKLQGLEVFAVSGDTRPGRDTPIGVDQWFSKPLKPTQFVETLNSRFSNQLVVA